MSFERRFHRNKSSRSYASARLFTRRCCSNFFSISFHSLDLNNVSRFRRTDAMRSPTSDPLKGRRNSFIESPDCS